LTLLVFERLFSRLEEQRGSLNRWEVARTERNIINWCRPNHYQTGQLFRPERREVFSHPQSVELVIAGEKTMAKKAGGPWNGFWD